MPETFGRYELLSLLGQGGMAEVYRARRVSETGVGKQVVVKRILPAYSNRPEFRAMFLDEGRLTTQLSHGNVVQVFEASEAEGQLFLAMEWVDGVGLDKVLARARERQARLPPVVAVLILIEALKGLHHAHTRQGEDGRLLRIVHRDISPDNLLIGFEGQVKVSDFGIAKAALEGRPETESGVFKGKLMYGAPEQIRGEKVDARADVFSLGVVLHEMLSGNNPIGQRAIELALKGEPLPRVGTFFVGEELPEIVARATASKPDERYPSALAFQQALTGWMLPRAGVHATTGVASLMTWLFPSEAGARGLAAELDRDTMRWLESNPASPEPRESTPFEPTALSPARLAEAQAQLPHSEPDAAPVPGPPPPGQPSARKVLVGLGVAALLAGVGYGALRWGARAADQQALAAAREAFAARDLARATSLLSPLIHREPPLAEAAQLTAEVDAEVRPTAALQEANRLANEAARRHQPPDWAAEDHLLEVASSTTHFKPALEQLRQRIQAVYQLSNENLSSAEAALRAHDPARVKALLPCPADACSDEWYATQLQQELVIRQALDDTDRLLANNEVTEARAAFEAASRTLYQEPRREQLHQKLGVGVSDARLEAAVRHAVETGDFAGARKWIDDCHAEGTVCESADRVRAELELEEQFDLDARRAEEQSRAGKTWVAHGYLEHSVTHWQTGRRQQLFRLVDQGPRSAPPDLRCAQASQNAKKAPVETLPEAQRCAAKYPESWKWQLTLGEIYDHALHDERHAVESFHRYLELSPTHDEARESVEARLKGIAHPRSGDDLNDRRVLQQQRGLTAPSVSK
ncbi:MAG: serine/threonine-protein kinase [Myxococcaceae bacterium]